MALRQGLRCRGFVREPAAPPRSENGDPPDGGMCCAFAPCLLPAGARALPFATHPPDELPQSTLVCLLLEHQSGLDPQAPLRTLLYAVLYWEAVFTEVLRRLEPLSEQENVRWHDLLRFVLSWAFWRRPGSERRQLVEVARESQSAAAHREEVTRVSETIARTWSEELVAQGLIEGEMRTRREDLRILLEEKFGALPEEWVRRIEAAQDLERLKSAVRQVLHIRQLAELDL
jgi:hypothetical protein